jgi:CrcB protein
VLRQLHAIGAVALGGAIGAVLRYGVAGLVQQSTGAAIGLGTLAVNVSGALALGFLARMYAPPHGSPILFLALTVGLCGGYTTFSTFSLDMFTLVERGQALRAIMYAFVTVMLSYGALAIGYGTARVLRP